MKLSQLIADLFYMALALFAGYVLFKMWQAVSGTVTSIQQDGQSALNALTGVTSNVNSTVNSLGSQASNAVQGVTDTATSAINTGTGYVSDLVDDGPDVANQNLDNGVSGYGTAGTMVSDAVNEMPLTNPYAR